MIIPLNETWYLSVHATNIMVQQVIAIVRTKFVDGFRYFGFAFGGDIFPDATVVETQFGFHGVVGIAHITRVDEKVGAEASNRFKRRHSASRNIDSIALSCSVTRPSKSNIASFVGSGDESSCLWCT